MPKKKQTFEESMDNLEKLVKELEAGELPLDDIVKKYRESAGLIKFCREQLENADRTVCELLEIDAFGQQVPLHINTKGREDDE